ncbi:MAG: GGDEF domain-containing protein [Planctomycetes bacterium]|nr:GGDEF domain-containing protein [Planctomycetota bacterium]
MPRTKYLVDLLIWCVPPSLIALVTGVAIIQGITHPWLDITLLIALVLGFLVTLYGAGLSLYLFEGLQASENTIERLTSNIGIHLSQISLLRREVDTLSAMREIHSTSHIASFDELLLNIFKVLYAATDALSIGIYLEDPEGRGIYPKAYIEWAQANSKIPGELFLFLNERLPLPPEGEICGFISPHLQGSLDSNAVNFFGDCMHADRNVGKISYSLVRKDDTTVDANQVRSWVRNLSVTTLGVDSCWETRSPSIVRVKSGSVISVPLFHQGLVVGVIAVHYQPSGEAGSAELDTRKMAHVLLDYGRNIGLHIIKEELYEQAIKDRLTGLFNRAHYANQLAINFHRMVRYQRDLSFIVIDIDHFKKVNDTYGHHTGDLVLKGVSRILMENIRKSDMAFRYGGEELAIMLVETPLDEAIGVAEKLRILTESTTFPTDQGDRMTVTASFGVSSLSSAMSSPEDLPQSADKALYEAKRTGRNRVVSADSLGT